MKVLKKIFLFIALFSFFNSFASFADLPRYIDFKKVLNESIAGKEAQNVLRKKFESESSKFKKKETELRKKEQEIIGKKKVISNEEYKKEVEKLRAEVGKLRKDRQNSLTNVANLRGKAKTDLLKKLNPIIDFGSSPSSSLSFDRHSDSSFDHTGFVNFNSPGRIHSVNEVSGRVACNVLVCS